MKALLAEKPSVASDLANALGASTKRSGFFEGNGIVVTWAFGHLLTAADPSETDPRWAGEWTFAQLPMLPPALTYKVEDKKKQQLKVVEETFNRPDVDEIVCCTDAGREGELIFRLIYQHSRTRKRTSRLWTSSLTAQALQKAFNNRKPGTDYDNLAAAASTRALADWTFGNNLTRAYTLLNGSLYRVGRVKTPTLAMVVERDREISAFQSEAFYEVVVTYSQGFTGKYTYSQNDKPTTRLIDPDLAAHILSEIRASGSGIVRKKDVEKRSVPPPLLYNLLTLQKAANNKFGFTAAQTLQLAQSLYETHKLITYPRTESISLPSDMVSQLPHVLQSLPGRYKLKTEGALSYLQSRSLTKRHVDDDKLTDHHAIVPAINPKADSAKLSENEAELYDLIVTRFLSMFCSDHLFNAITVETHFNQHVVVSQGKEILEVGWWQLVEDATEEEKNSDESEAENEQTIPSLSLGQSMALKSAQRKDRKTAPPKHYTDATLLAAMKGAGSRVSDNHLADYIKHAGIGTAATRAHIIEELIENGLLLRVKKNIVAASSAGAFCDQVLLPIKDPTTTADWEQHLANIEAGTGAPAEFVSRLHSFLTSTIAQIRTTPPIADPGVGICPSCATGRIRFLKKFYGCNRYREGCTFTLPSIWCEKTLSLKNIQELLESRKTSLIEGFKSSRTTKKYAAYLELDDTFKLKMSFPQRQTPSNGSEELR
jgi:DNA topoisomerase-3